MKYSAIIVEDEPMLSEHVSNLVASCCQDISIIGIADCGVKAERMINALKPDLVFMDVELPDMNAFKVLEQILHLKLELIFTTVHDHYAVEAFEHNAIHYLLKPISKDNLTRAVERFIQRKKDQEKSDLTNILEKIKESESTDKKIRLPNLNGFSLASVNQIVRLEAEGRYTKIYTLEKEITYQKTKPELVSINIKEFETRLSDYNFFRAHNSHLVNLDFVKAYVKGKGGILKMETGEDIPVSREKKGELLKRLSNI